MASEHNSGQISEKADSDRAANKAPEIVSIQSRSTHKTSAQSVTQKPTKMPAAAPNMPKPPKQTKERLVEKFQQDMGGVISYWRKIPVNDLRTLDAVLEQNPEAKGAIAHLVQQLQEAKQTNTRVNQRNFGLNQTAAKHERTADYLTKANAQLEEEKNELIKQIHNLVAALTNYENSELRQAVIRVRNYIAGMIQP